MPSTASHVIVAVPRPLATISPFSFTVATASLDDVHFSAALAAFSGLIVVFTTNLSPTFTVLLVSARTMDEIC